MEIKRLFDPQSIAVVGASDTPGKVGNIIARNILRLGYRGTVFLVNPSRRTVLGRKSYPHLEEIDQPVDLAIVAVPAEAVLDVVKFGSAKTKNFVIISAGFAETGPEGRRREEKLRKFAREHGLAILGPNCLGFIIPGLGLNASFASGMPEAGNIALVSQSGALVVAFMDIARRERIGFSRLISIGNKMQIDETDLIELLADDPKTKVIGLYLEGIGDGLRFMETAARVAAKKPVVVLKAGKTDRAQQAIASHTGALAGSDRIADEAFERCGIVRASNLENFVDLLKLISLNPVPKKDNRVAVVTNAGGPGVLTTDAFLGKEIKLGEISPAVQKKFRSFLPTEASVSNPIDLLGDAGEERYRQTFEILEKEAFGAVLCLLTPQDQTPVEKIAEQVILFQKRTDKVVATSFIGGERIRGAVNHLRISGVNNFSYPDRAVEALDKYYRWSRLTRKKKTFPKIKSNEKRRRQALVIAGHLLGTGRKALYFAEAASLVKLYGINAVPFQNLKSGDESKINYPLVLKVDSAETLHKTDKKGVVVGIRDAKHLEAEMKSLAKRFPGEKQLIQPFLEVRTELIAGLKRDPVFGPVVVFGLGGIYAEIFKTIHFLVGPLTTKEIEAEVLRSPIAYIFSGARGQKPHNLSEFVSILEKLMLLGQELDSVRELDINPLLIYNDGRKAAAVDIKIIF